MKYSVEYTEEAVKQLKKFDHPITILIYGWIERHLSECENPRIHGKPLAGDKKGYWRYRVGDYRIIAEIQDNALKIIIISAGHRRDVYR